MGLGKGGVWLLQLSYRQILIISSVLLLLLIGAATGAYYWKNRPAYYEQTGPLAPAGPPLGGDKPTAAMSVEPIRFVAVGETATYDSIHQNAKQADGSYDYGSLMKDMAEFMDADITLCPQASPSGGPAYGITGHPEFNADKSLAAGLVSVHCNVIGLASAHANDKGQKAIDSTIDAWVDASVLAFSGMNKNEQEQGQLSVFEVKGVKFGFASFTTSLAKPLGNEFGVNQYSSALAKKQLQQLRNEADVVIVNIAWGNEYNPEITAAQDEIAQQLADFGADVIVGHGPRVLQPVKKLKADDGREVIAWYSLGNFLNSQLPIDTLTGGLAVMEVDVQTKKVKIQGLLPIYQHYEWTAADKSSQNLLARKNFRLLPLDAAESLLPKAQHDTTVELQRTRIKKLINKHTTIPLLSQDDLR